MQDVIKPVTGKLGFVQLPFKQLYSKYFKPVTPEVRPAGPPNYYLPYEKAEYISPMILKENMCRCMSMFSFNEGLIQAIQLVLGSDVYISDIRKSITETTAEMIFDIKNKADNLFYHVSVDHVPAIKLDFWTIEAAMWITRDRLWPPHETIQSIVAKGCHLVARSSPGGDKHSEWRISFSGPEAILAQCHSKKQRQHTTYSRYYFIGISKVWNHRKLTKNLSSHTPWKPPCCGYVKSYLPMIQCGRVWNAVLIFFSSGFNEVLSLDFSHIISYQTSTY